MNTKIFLALLIVASFFLVSCGSSGLEITNPIKHCQTVQVAYQDMEEYKVDLKYEESGTKTTTMHGLDVWAVGEVRVRNVDSETGAFTVYQTFSTLNRGSQTLQSTQYVMPGETKTFRQEYDISFGEDFNMVYSVTPAQKTLTHLVTKYRSEEQCS